ncbi:MAG: PH domain-containing protein, partial [Verrucomicrobiota bacterium]
MPPPLPFSSATPPKIESSLNVASLLEGRLHPLTLFFVAWNTVRNLLIPAIIYIAAGRDRSLGFILLAVGGVSFVNGLIQYFSFKFRIENGELITRQGIIEKTERHIPLARVQDLRVEQKLLHRILGVVDIFVETAGGKGAEAKLSVLTKPEAERLRQAVFERVTALPGAAADVAAVAAR